jgi:hypothetical protein
MGIQKSEKTFGPIRYGGEVVLRNVPPIIGYRIDRGHYGIHELTSIAANGVCFGIDVRFKEAFRIKETWEVSPKQNKREF